VMIEEGAVVSTMTGKSVEYRDAKGRDTVVMLH